MAEGSSEASMSQYQRIGQLIEQFFLALPLLPPSVIRDSLFYLARLLFLPHLEPVCFRFCFLFSPSLWSGTKDVPVW